MAIRLAKHFNTSIISADSRQCYRELNIGVAKPGNQELQEVQHYFIDSHSIHEEVNAATFEAYALDACARIFASSSVAIMVGGTGLYLKAFAEGIDEIPAADPMTRAEILHEYAQKGIDWLRETVEKEDPLFFVEGESRNPQRLMRALEVVRTTGKSIRTYQQGKKSARAFSTSMFVLDAPRKDLYNAIDRRVDQMIADGLENEVSALIRYRYLNALNTVGYKEWFDYFDGNSTREQTIEKIKQHTRQYAKRQLTWFRKQQAIWIGPTDDEVVIRNATL